MSNATCRRIGQELLLGLCLGLCPSIGLSQVIGPFPVATSLQFPITTSWDCTPASLQNCGQPVGNYYSVVDAATQRHAFCGRHLAEDISVEAGARVVAIGDGIVRYSRFRKALGRVVNVEHMLPDRTFFTSVYMHLARRSEMSSVDVAALPEEGALIRKGEFVGVVSGNPADNFGAEHLHLGIRYEDTTGYRGSAAIDSRTGTKYYVGYSTHFLPSGLRRCDADPPGSIAEDEANPDHNIIVGEWRQPPESLAPRQFIEARLISPPLPSVTFVATGTVTNVLDMPGLLSPYFGTIPVPGDSFTVRYTFNSVTADTDPRPEAGVYLGAIRELTLTVGSNPPLTFSAQNLTDNYIDVRTSPYSAYTALIGDPRISNPTSFSHAIALFRLAEPLTGQTDALPTSPPLLSDYTSNAMQFASTLGGGVASIDGVVTSLLRIPE